MRKQGKAGSHAEVLLLQHQRRAKSGLCLQDGSSKSVFSSSKPCSATLMNSVCHFRHFFTRSRLVIGVMFGVAEAPKHGEWLH